MEDFPIDEKNVNILVKELIEVNGDGLNIDVNFLNVDTDIDKNIEVKDESDEDFIPYEYQKKKRDRSSLSKPHKNMRIPRMLCSKMEAQWDVAAGKRLEQSKILKRTARDRSLTRINIPLLKRA